MVTYRTLKNYNNTLKLHDKNAFLGCFSSFVMGYNDYFTTGNDEEFDKVGFQVISSFFNSF